MQPRARECVCVCVCVCVRVCVCCECVGVCMCVCVCEWVCYVCARVRGHECVCVRFVGLRTQGLRNAPNVYPSGSHIESTVVACSREKVRRAKLVHEMIQRYYPEVRSRGQANWCSAVVPNWRARAHTHRRS